VGTRALTARKKVAVGEVAVVLELIQHNDMAQVGQTLAGDGQFPARQSGYERGDHVEVTAGFEVRRCDKRLAGRGPKHMLELENPVGWINIDQDQPGLRGGELDYGPLSAVGGPDPQPISGKQTYIQESGGQLVGMALQLGICPPDFLAERDQRVAITIGGGDFIEKAPDTQADEWLSSMAMNITEIRHGTVRF
jgi:hypothetical protein